jgi:hypothetical protein
LIEEHDTILSQSADSELAMPGMADFSDYEDIQGHLEDASDGGGYDNASPRQTHHQIRLDSFCFEELAQPFACVFSR